MGEFRTSEQGRAQGEMGMGMRGTGRWDKGTFMASILERRSSWYPPVMGPRLSTRSPSRVMESKFVVLETWLAVSKSRQIII